VSNELFKPLKEMPGQSSQKTFGLSRKKSTKKLQRTTKDRIGHVPSLIGNEFDNEE